MKAACRSQPCWRSFFPPARVMPFASKAGSYRPGADPTSRMAIGPRHPCWYDARLFSAPHKTTASGTVCALLLGSIHSRREGALGSRHAGKAVSTKSTQHQRAHRDSRGRHHLPGHGLHPVRQPEHPRRDRHGQGRAVRRHLPGRSHRLGDHGHHRQLPDRPGAGHGPERLLHLHRGPAHGPHLAGGIGRGVPLRSAVLPAVDLPHPRVDREQHPAAAALGHCRRHRPVPGADRPA